MYFCFINGKLPVGPRICLPGEAFNASVQCNGAWEKETTLIRGLYLAERGSPSLETAQAGREGAGLPHWDSRQAPDLPRPQFPLPQKGDDSAHPIYLQGLMVRLF